MSKVGGSCHVVPIRLNGAVVGFQLRVGTAGPGQTKYFAAAKLGGEELALKEAHRFARSNGLAVASGRRGGVVGRRMPTSGVEPGIRFKWVGLSDTKSLVVVVTWPARRGRNPSQPGRSSFAVSVNGLAGALDLAIERRVRAGAPPPDRRSLLKALRETYSKGP